MNKFTFSYKDVSSVRKTLEIYAVSLQDAATQYQLAQLEDERNWYAAGKNMPEFIEWSLVAVVDHGTRELAGK
jgi:hypothetical protein